MSDHHPTLPPSSFPGFAACPQYVRDGGSNDAMETGTDNHALLAAALNGLNVHYPDTETDLMLEWAIREIKTIARVRLWPERRVTLYDNELNEITFGTADVLIKNPPTVIDFKSGYPSKSYREQLELYALAWMQEIGAENCECVILYGAARKTDSWSVSYREAYTRTMNIIESLKRGTDPARPCEFCEWCSKSLTCLALSGVAVKVATEYTPTLDLTEYHASKITDPAQMAKALAVAEILEDWAKSVKHHAKELARGGAAIPNYALKPGRERREVIDILSSYKASGMTAEEFLSCCSVSVPDLEKIVAKQLGNKSVTKAVKQELAARLGNLIEVKQGDVILTKERK